LEFVQSLSLADDLPTFFIKYDIATRNRVETCRDFYDASAAAAVVQLTGDVFGHEAHYSGVHCIDAPAP
jgi:hypothetical protein